MEVTLHNNPSAQCTLLRESEFMRSVMHVLGIVRNQLDPFFQIRDWFLERLIDYVDGQA